MLVTSAKIIQRMKKGFLWEKRARKKVSSCGLRVQWCVRCLPAAKPLPNLFLLPLLFFSISPLFSTQVLLNSNFASSLPLRIAFHFYSNSLTLFPLPQISLSSALLRFLGFHAFLILFFQNQTCRFIIPGITKYWAQAQISICARSIF